MGPTKLKNFSNHSENRHRMQWTKHDRFPKSHLTFCIRWQRDQVQYYSLSCTVAVWPQKTFFPLLIRPQGSQGCQKITFFFSQMKVFSFCAKIDPNRHKLKKTIKIEEKMSKNPCFLRYFQIFFNFGVILAHQTSTGMFSGSWGLF